MSVTWHVQNVGEIKQKSRGGSLSILLLNFLKNAVNLVSYFSWFISLLEEINQDHIKLTITLSFFLYLNFFGL